ncbi:MAG: T9SS type A sorting domain-containing protein, partial [Bacteroidia bacterium]
KNELLIWEVFAAKGLGYGASQGSSTSRSDGTEDFSIPPHLLGLTLSKIADEEIENYDSLTYTIVASNSTNWTIAGIEIKDTLEANLSLDLSSLSCGATFSNGVITWSIDSIGSGDSMMCTFMVGTSFDNVTEILTTDSVESSESSWTVSKSLGASNGWELSTTRSKSGSSSWFVSNEATRSDYYLTDTLVLDTINSPVFSFWHWYNTEESWDGGVVEIRDGGAWSDAKPYFVKNGYNRTIAENDMSAISQREAFSGNSGQFIQSKLDLQEFAGKSIEIRFRFSSDAAASEEGWYLDDFRLEDAVTTTNNVYASYEQTRTSQSLVSTTIYGEVKPDNVGVPEFEKLSTRVYPNPASDVLIIEDSSNEKFSYELLNMEGKVLLSGSSDGIEKINVKNFASGHYIISINKKGVSENHKLLLK